MFGLSLPNLSSGTRSTFKLALRFFWGETRVLLFCYLFASGPCRPTIISSPFPPPTNTGRFATQKSTISLRDFGGGNGYPQISINWVKRSQLCPQQTGNMSRGVHVSTRFFRLWPVTFFVFYWWPSAVKLLTLHHLGDQHVTYWKKLAWGIYAMSHVINNLTPEKTQKNNKLPIFRYRKTSQTTTKTRGNTSKTYPKTTKNNQPPPKTIPRISSTHQTNSAVGFLWYLYLGAPDT